MNPEDKLSDAIKVVERNVNALLRRKEEAISNRRFRQKVIDSVTAFASSMNSVYLHLIIYGTWIAWNLGWLGLKPFDPDFVLMGTFAAIEAIFLTTVVLIGQKFMKVQTSKWAELDLQVSLLTEHELTRVLNLVIEIAKKMDIKEAEDKETVELAKDIHPEKVLDTMEEITKNESHLPNNK